LEEVPDDEDPGLNVSVAIGTEMFTAEVMFDEESHGREHVAVQALEWLQEAKNRKFTDLIKLSQARPGVMDSGTAAEEDLNDID
jgi:hypothetical protein